MPYLLNCIHRESFTLTWKNMLVCIATNVRKNKVRIEILFLRETSFHEIKCIWFIRVFKVCLKFIGSFKFFLLLLLLLNIIHKIRKLNTEISCLFNTRLKNLYSKLSLVINCIFIHLQRILKVLFENESACSLCNNMLS